MRPETRALHAEFRATDTDKRRFEAKVMVYGVVDDYGTLWQPGVFTESLAAKLPKIVWGHDWTDVLGRYVDYRDTDTDLTLVGEFDDFEAVPRARQAYAQLQSGTIDEFSVGFRRKEWRAFADVSADDYGEEAMAAMAKQGCQEIMVRALLDEASLVLVGAVPETELIGVRSIRMANGQTVPEDFVIDLGRKLAAGDITRAEADAALDLVAGTGKGDEPTTDADLEAVLAEADQVLDAI